MELTADTLVRACSDAVALAIRLAQEATTPETFAQVEDMYRSESLNVHMAITVQPDRMFLISLEMCDSNGDQAAHLVSLKARCTDFDIWIQ